MITITLPDGSRREYPAPLTVADVAASIGAGLAKAALARPVPMEAATSATVKGAGYSRREPSGR